VLTTAWGAASALAAAEEVVAAAERAAGCGERAPVGVVVELRAASVAVGPAVVGEAGQRVGRPAAARIADHRG
jgi:hypothetical protein